MRAFIFLAVCCAFIGGCTDDTSPSAGMRQRQDQALKDPFNYSPDIKDDAVGGGGTLDFKKDAFRRDVSGF